MKFILLLLIIPISFIACNEEYFPDPDAYRDPSLTGTWVLKFTDTNDSIIEVFTEDGYYDNVSAIKNGTTITYSNLGGIWENRDDDSELVIYSKCSNSNLSHKAWENYEHYKFSEDKDTLYKKSTTSPFEVYVRSKTQLLYNGAKFEEVDVNR